MLQVKRADYLALCKAWETLHNAIDGLKAAIITADPQTDKAHIGNAWDNFTDEYPKRYDDAIAHCAMIYGDEAISDFPADAETTKHKYSEIFEIVD